MAAPSAAAASPLAAAAAAVAAAAATSTTTATAAAEAELQYFLDARLPGKPDRLDVVACVAYDGTAFHGWQAQAPPSTAAAKHKVVRTVEASLGAAISAAIASPSGARVPVSGVSRTDADVSARGQLVWFSVPASTLEASRCHALALRDGINAALAAGGARAALTALRLFRPSQVQLRNAAGDKTYSYYIAVGARGPHRDLTPAQLRHAVYRNLSRASLPALAAAAAAIVGEHDCRHFASPRPLSPATVRRPSAGGDLVDGVGDDAASSDGDGDGESSGGGAGATTSWRLRRSDDTTRRVSRVTAALLTADEYCVDFTRPQLAPPCGHDVAPPGVTLFDVTEAGPRPPAVVGGIDDGAAVLRLTLTGNGFLRHMVRRLVHCLLATAEGHVRVEEWTALLLPPPPPPPAVSPTTSRRAPELPPHLAAAVAPAPGRGLVLEAIDLPPGFWTAADYCNNPSPGYAAEYGLTLAK